MDSFLNTERPAVFCPGCSHDRVLQSLNQAFVNMGLAAENIVIVTDIGCSGLFDTFFNTHAFHGLHGRALTYATGLKMARPELQVIVTMGDGGLGIGGAHVLSTCRRNIDLTLLVLNNFNYGMTGGQCSSTTPNDAVVGSGFLNRLEKPLDICQVAAAAGAPYAERCSSYARDLPETLAEAIKFDGFSVLDIWGACTGRYTRRNMLTPKIVAENLEKESPVTAITNQNQREEYGAHYRKEAAAQPLIEAPTAVEAVHQPVSSGRNEVVFLGSAGQRIVTAGELLCLSGLGAGLHATQKNDYPITVLRGHSVSELILSDQPIDYTGISDPAVVVALAPEGVTRRKAMFGKLSATCLVVKGADLEMPETPAEVVSLDFKTMKIKKVDWALAALTCLAVREKIISLPMLETALENRFKGKVLEMARSLVGQVAEATK